MTTRIDSAIIERIRDELIELKGRHALECTDLDCLWVGGLLAFFAQCPGCGSGRDGARENPAADP